MVVWLQGKENVSNNQIKQKFKMGYDVAKRFLSHLEDAGIVSVLARGSKRPRTVYPDKAKEFLRRHGHTSDVIQNIDQTLDTHSIQPHTEPVQEQITESDDKVPNSQEHTSESPAVTQPKLARIDPEFIKSQSIRNIPKKTRKYKR